MFKILGLCISSYVQAYHICNALEENNNSQHSVYGSSANLQKFTKIIRNFGVVT